MARNLTRTDPDQVGPDALLYRRLRAPYSIGAPVAESEAQFPLLSRSGVGVFDLLELKLKAPKGKREVPWLEYGNVVYSINSKGASWGPRTATSLFTLASKMACPSFSLPSGPPSEQGTCSSASMSFQGRVGERDYICDECYAMEGNYPFPEVALAQAARLSWVKQQLEADPSGETLGRQLAQAISWFAELGSGGDLSTRITLELGVWKDGSLVVPAKLKAFKPNVWMVEGVSTKLPELGIEDSREFFASRGVKNGDTTGFFRIHDSGDFTVGRHSAGYIRAWGLAARLLPQVIFWAPTRLAVFEKYRKLFSGQARQAPNLLIRPSALHVDDAPPNIKGLAAGTGVLRDKMENLDRICPVRPHGFPYSCMAASCRACWLTDETIAYREH